MSKVGGPAVYSSPASKRWRCAARWLSDLAWSLRARAIDWLLECPRKAARARWRLVTSAVPRKGDDMGARDFRRWVSQSLDAVGDAVALEWLIQHAMDRAKLEERARRRSIGDDWRAYINGGIVRDWAGNTDSPADRKDGFLLRSAVSHALTEHSMLMMVQVRMASPMTT